MPPQSYGDGLAEGNSAPICCPTTSHSHTCLLSSTVPTRPLPSPNSDDTSTQDQQREFANSARIQDLSTLPVDDSQPSVHASPCGITDRRSSIYGIQTSSVRDLPKGFPVDEAVATTFSPSHRMSIAQLPPIQTMLSTQLHNDATSQKFMNVDAPCPRDTFNQLSYPSPSSTTGALIYDSSPLETFRHRKLGRPNDTRQMHSGVWSAVVESSQTFPEEQRETHQRHIADPDKAPSSALDWYQSLGNMRGAQSAPSAFSSSDIEMASSVGSPDEDEDSLSNAADEELTITLGSDRARARNPSLAASNDARTPRPTSLNVSASLSVKKSLQSDTSSLSVPSSMTAVSHSLPNAEESSNRASLTPGISPFASDSDGSGSDYEVTAKIKRPASKQAKTLKKKKAKTTCEKPTTKVVPSAALRRRRRSGKRKVGADDNKDRSFQCEYCPMAFHRRHDMKVSPNVPLFRKVCSSACLPDK